MFKHGVSIALLASVLERETPARLVPIYGPIGDGIIDLYPISDRITETLTARNLPNMSTDLAELTYLETIVYPELQTIRVKGVAGIKQLFPVVSPVWRMVLLERKVDATEIEPSARDLVGPGWFLFYNRDIMKMTGLQSGNLAALCAHAGLTIIGGTELKLLVRMPEDRYRTQNGDTVLKDGNRYLRELTDLHTFDQILFKGADHLRMTPRGAFEEIDRDLWRPVPDEQIRTIEGKRYREVVEAITTIDTKRYQTLPVQLEFRKVKHGWQNKLEDRLIKFDDIYLQNLYGRFIPPGQIRFINGKSYRVLQPDRWISDDDGALEQIDLDIWVSIPEDALIQEGNQWLRLIDPQNLGIEDGQYYEILNPKILKLSELKPSEYVAAKVSAAKRQNQRLKLEQSKENARRAQSLPEPQKRVLLRQQIIIPPTPLMRAAEFVIAETEGSNLKEIMALPGIDKTLTTCNNMYTITETLGIEAARTFLVRELTNTIANAGSYVHPAHLIFIAEFITSRGEPYGATYTGISRQPGRFISLASLERAGKVFTQSALHGRKEDVRNVSAAVAVGARMAIGSGACEVAQDIVVDGVPTTVLNDDLFEALERDDGTKELRAARQRLAPSVQPEDLMSAIDELGTFTVNEFTFDFAGPEDESLGLIPVPEVQTQKGLVHTVPKLVSKITPATNQHGMIDILQQIKIGYPSISSLEPLGGTQAPAEVPQPIVSTGLVAPAQIRIPPGVTPFPADLNNLLMQYMGTLDVGEAEDESLTQNLEPQAPPGTRVDLPSVPIPDLPDLEGLQLGRDLVTLRREQVRDLDTIDTDELEAALAQK
jgi:hypothetical protein